MVDTFCAYGNYENRAKARMGSNSDFRPGDILQQFIELPRFVHRQNPSDRMVLHGFQGGVKLVDKKPQPAFKMTLSGTDELGGAEPAHRRRRT